VSGTYKSKSGKNWVEMTTQELREEIAHLVLTLDRTTNKNKRRKRALKDMNRSMLVSFKTREDILKLHNNLKERTRIAEKRAQAAEEAVVQYAEDARQMAQYAHGLEAQRELLAQRTGYTVDTETNKLTPPQRPSFWSRLFGKTDHANQS